MENPSNLNTSQDIFGLNHSENVLPRAMDPELSRYTIRFTVILVAAASMVTAGLYVFSRLCGCY